jgi:hypothetical protein
MDGRDEFVAFVNGLIAEMPLAEPADAEARFQADLTKIRAYDLRGACEPMSALGR